MSQLSTVPNASSPAAARARACGTWSSSHFNLVPEKYASISRPVLNEISGACPAAFSAAQVSAVRRACQTKGGGRGGPPFWFPKNGGFSLVGNPQWGKLRGGPVGLGEAPRGGHKMA